MSFDFDVVFRVVASRLYVSSSFIYSGTMLFLILKTKISVLKFRIRLEEFLFFGGELCAVNCAAFTRKFLLFHSMIVVSSSEFMIIACVLLELRQKLFSTVHLWRLYRSKFIWFIQSDIESISPLIDSQYHHLNISG
jgi:hypothetical protein